MKIRTTLDNNYLLPNKDTVNKKKYNKNNNTESKH